MIQRPAGGQYRSLCLSRLPAYADDERNVGLTTHANQQGSYREFNNPVLLVVLFFRGGGLSFTPWGLLDVSSTDERRRAT